MSLALAQDIVPAITDGAAEAKARLQALGVDQFTKSRLAQLHHALNHSSSVWFAKSDDEKQAIRSDIVAILGNIPKIETMASIREKAAAKAAKDVKRKPSEREAPDISFIKDKRLRELLLARAPHRPYCCDEFCANSPRPLEMALRKKHLQLNPPGFCSFIIKDLDYANASDAWKDKGLPAPTWAATNPENGHAHLVWALTDPVWKGGENQKPARLFDAVQEAFREVLDGCEGYSHLLTKNPASDAWILSSESGFATYDLGYLASFVKLSRKGKKKRATESIGRNCLIFDELRKWAYSSVNLYEDPLTFGAAVAGHAEMLNASLANPMLPNEVLGIIRSVSKWTWKCISYGNGKTSAELASAQAARGRKSGAARRAKNEKTRQRACELADGWGAEMISRLTDTPKSTITHWVRDLRITKKEENRTRVYELSNSWSAEMVSRLTNIPKSTVTRWLRERRDDLKVNPNISVMTHEQLSSILSDVLARQPQIKNDCCGAEAFAGCVVDEAKKINKLSDIQIDQLRCYTAFMYRGDQLE